jgi:hypothetical protein
MKYFLSLESSSPQKVLTKTLIRIIVVQEKRFVFFSFTSTVQF